jgi:hypothetical protein
VIARIDGLSIVLDMRRAIVAVLAAPRGRLRG